MRFFLILLLALFSKAFASDLNPEGVASLYNCAGSFVIFNGMPTTSKALVLTNGHCMKFMKSREVHADEPAVRKVRLYDTKGVVHNFETARLVYATMKDTDIAIYELNETYDDVKSISGISPIPLASDRALIGEQIKIISGRLIVYDCHIEQFVPKILEGDWTWTESIRYTSACQVEGGTSGSAILSVTGPRKVIGINNTASGKEELCSLGNPCELNSGGKDPVNMHASYGQQTYKLYTCLTPSFDLDLTKDGCQLPKKYSPDEEKLLWMKKLIKEYPLLTLARSENPTMGTSVTGTVYYSAKAVEQFELLHLLHYTCHEIGHHLGETTGDLTPRFGLAFEGEADYFSGKCLGEFLKKHRRDFVSDLKTTTRSSFCSENLQCDEFVSLITASIMALTDGPVDAQAAVEGIFPGINQQYPEKNCRALSAISGFLSLPRPKCWYNP